MMNCIEEKRRTLRSLSFNTDSAFHGKLKGKQLISNTQSLSSAQHSSPNALVQQLRSKGRTKISKSYIFSHFLHHCSSSSVQGMHKKSAEGSHQQQKENQNDSTIFILKSKMDTVRIYPKERPPSSKNRPCKPAFSGRISGLRNLRAKKLGKPQCFSITPWILNVPESEGLLNVIDSQN